MLHLGNHLAEFLSDLSEKDIRRLAVESIEMFMDVIGNANLYMRITDVTGDELHYAKIYKQYLRYSSTDGFHDSDNVSGIYSTQTCCNVCSFKTSSGCWDSDHGDYSSAIDLSQVGGTKAAKGCKLFPMPCGSGICQGLSVFPGFSRSGMTIGAGLMSGFSPNAFAVVVLYFVDSGNYRCTDRGT